MSTRNWFRTHRRQLSTHSLIIVGFILFTTLAAGPLFDGFEVEEIPEEAQLVDISVPAETGNIRYWFESIVTGEMVEFLGWAFIEGDCPENSTTYLVFESDQATYVFEADMRGVSTLNWWLGVEEPDLTEAGFVATVAAKRLTDGTYTIGVYIKKGEMEALQYTGRVLTKMNGVVKVSGE